VQEVTYHEDAHKIRLTLRPRPDLDCKVEGDKVSFDERLKWLRMLDALQTLLDGKLESSSYPLFDVSRLAFIVTRRGRKRIVTEEEAKAYYAAHPRRLPRPPRIQALLKQALAWQAELAASPSLTQDALARRNQVSSPRMTKVLHLLALAPEIRQYVLAMPLSTKRGPVTERQLRRIAGLADLEAQLQEFQRLLAGAGNQHPEQGTI
jgi:hypothetical protein